MSQYTDLFLFVCTNSQASAPVISAVAQNRWPVSIIRLDSQEARKLLASAPFTISHVPTLVVVKPDGRAQLYQGAMPIQQWFRATFLATENHPPPMYPGPAYPPGSSHIPPGYPGGPPLTVGSTTIGGGGSYAPQMMPIVEEPRKKKSIRPMPMPMDEYDDDDDDDEEEIIEPRRKKTAVKPKKKGLSQKIGGKPRRQKKKDAEEETTFEIVGGDEEDEERPSGMMMDARTARGSATAPPPRKTNRNIMAMAHQMEEERKNLLKQRFGSSYREDKA